MMGEVLAGHQALEGAPLAPGTLRSLDQLLDPVRHPAVPYSLLPEAIRNRTSEHLKSILENARDCELLFQVAQLFARARIPRKVLEGLRVGRLAAFQKPNGGVRGIVAGDVFRRLVARTIAQQLGPAIEWATHCQLGPSRL